MKFTKTVLAIGFTATLMATGCSTGPERDASGAIIEAAELDAFKIKVGDCMAPTGDVEELFSVDAVPCSDAHETEAYHVFDLADGDYPGNDSILTSADDKCVAAFEAYVGVDYFDSSLDISYITPTPDSWTQGDHEIVCVVISMDGSLLTDSAKGSLL